MGELNEYLAILANWFSVLAPIFIVWSWILLMRNKRRETRMIEAVKKNPGSRPVILIVSLLRGQQNIRNQVENYRQQHECLKDIPDKHIIMISIEEIAGTASELTPDHVSKFMARLSQETGKIYRNATDVVHYFHGGPFPTAAIVGAQFANGPVVLLYHWNIKTSTYDNWGTLRHFPYAA